MLGHCVRGCREQVERDGSNFRLAKSMKAVQEQKHGDAEARPACWAQAAEARSPPGHLRAETRLGCRSRASVSPVTPPQPPTPVNSLTPHSLPTPLFQDNADRVAHDGRRTAWCMLTMVQLYYYGTVYGCRILLVLQL